MPAKYTHITSWLEEKDVHNYVPLFSDDWKGGNVKQIYYCKVCKQSRITRANSLSRDNKPCYCSAPYCAYDYDDWIDYQVFRNPKIQEHLARYRLADGETLQRAGIRHRLKCIVCKQDCESNLDNLKRGKKPCYCSEAHQATKSFEEWQKFTAFRKPEMKDHIYRYRLIDGEHFRGAGQSHTVNCQSCGCTANIILSTLAVGNTPCYCSSTYANSKSFDDWVKYTLFRRPELKDELSRYSLSKGETFRGSNHKHRLHCSSCGQDRSATLCSLVAGSKPCYCSKTYHNSKGFEDWANMAVYRNPDMKEHLSRYRLSHGESFKGVKYPHSVYCKRCGQDHTTLLYSLYIGASPCECSPKRGFDKTKPGWFYVYMLLNSKYGTIYKIGITNRDPAERMGKRALKLGWKRIHAKYYESGKAAQQIENDCKLELDKYNVIKSDSNFDSWHLLPNNGWSELYKRLPARINQLLETAN